jgi:hypothetical protein
MSFVISFETAKKCLRIYRYESGHVWLGRLIYAVYVCLYIYTYNQIRLIYLINKSDVTEPVSGSGKE